MATTYATELPAILLKFVVGITHKQMVRENAALNDTLVHKQIALEYSKMCLFQNLLLEVNSFENEFDVLSLWKQGIHFL